MIVSREVWEPEQGAERTMIAKQFESGRLLNNLSVILDLNMSVIGRKEKCRNEVEEYGTT